MYQYPTYRPQRARKAQHLSAGPWGQPQELPTAVALVDDLLSRELIFGTETAFRSVPAKTVAEAALAVRDTAARALLLSPSLMERESVSSIRSLLDRCPGVRSIAVLGTSRPAEPTQLVTLGSLGVHDVIDLRIPSDYDRLRNLVASYDPEVTGKFVTAILEELAGTSPEVKRFFGVLIQAAPDLGSASQLAALFGTKATTLISRFYRAEVPSPKLYLLHARLTHAAGYFENPRHSIADVAYRLRYSSPQSFGRNVRLGLGITAGEFRRSCNLASAIARFSETLISPYLSRFTSWRPLGG